MYFFFHMHGEIADCIWMHPFSFLFLKLTTDAEIPRLSDFMDPNHKALAAILLLVTEVTLLINHALSLSLCSSPTGPILCGKPILMSTVPSYCSLHFQKSEKHVTRALKKAGLTASNTNKVAPKFHVIVAEYVNHIQNKRRAAAQNTTVEIVEVKEENSS